MGLIIEFIKLFIMLIGIAVVGLLMLIFGPLLMIPAVFQKYNKKVPTPMQVVRIIVACYVAPIAGPWATTMWLTGARPKSMPKGHVFMLLAFSYSTFIWLAILIALRIIK